MKSHGTPRSTVKLNNRTRLIVALTIFSLFTLLMGATALMQTRKKSAKTDSGQAPQSVGATSNSDAVLVGPVTVTATGGTVGPTDYATLKAAFDAINAGTHQGAITIDVNGNTTETASAVLNNSGAGAAVYTSVSITPSGGPRTITGSIVGAIIKLNGADNVTIDGRIGGVGRNLSVINSNTSTATAAIWLASVVAGNGASNNVIRNLEIACGADQTTSTNTTIGILMSGTTISVTSNGDDNDNNSFIANRIIKARYGIVTRGVTTNLNINPVVTDNIIGPTAFGADEIGKTGILMQADTGALVSRNTVQFVGVLFAQAAGGGDRCGIGIGSDSWSTTDSTTITSNTYTVTKNIIHDIVEEKTFSSIGLKLGTTGGGSATNNLVANNFIYNVRANATSGDQVCGIGYANGHTDKIVFNSISMTGDLDPAGTTAAATYGSAIRVTQANGSNNANLTLMDNSIYLDVTSNTATVHDYAITLNSAAYSFGTGGLNYNNYYINASNAQLRTGGLATTGTGGTAATEFATLANWQAALTAPQDANSKQVDPLYISTTGDLHISPSSPNIDMGLAIAGVTDDIDSQARPNGASPDIGADEFYPSPGTLQFSSSTFTVSETAGTATITVTRASGINGAVSVDYATVAGGTATGGASCTAGVDYVNTNGTLMWGDLDGASKTFNVTICTDGVLEPGETVNLALSNPTGGATLGTPNTAVLTITDAGSNVSGSFNVGTGQLFTSLTNPGGIFEAINNNTVTGNITINIVSDLTGETGTVALNEVAGGFTVLIKPSGAARTITGSSTVGIIRLNGADNVTIDGSLTGGTATGIGGNPALRNLTVQNTNPGATAGGVIIIQSGTNGAQNDTVRNVNVMGQDPTQTLIGIALGGNTPGAAGTDNDNNRVENCSIQKAFLGIYNVGASLANQNTGTVLTMNDMTATGANRLRRGGILVFNENGVQITLNSVGGIADDESIDAYGIALGIQNVNTTATTGGGITNAVVSRNKINGIASTSTVGFTAAGIALAGDAGGANTISNNMILGVIAPSTSPDFVCGIFIAGVTGSSSKAYFNSISLTGDRGSVASQIGSYGIAISGTNPTVELKDNIFYNTQTSSGGAAAKSYAIGMASTTFTNLDSNYNDFFTSGANAAGFRTASLDTTGTDDATLAAWRTRVSDDANSLSVNPLFVSPTTDLHLQVSSPVLDLGTPVTGVTTDFDGDTRDANTPDIGADEVFSSLSIADASNVEGDSGSHNVSVTVTLSAASSQTVTASWSTGAGTATANVDYVQSSGTVTFDPNQTVQTILVPINGDILDEANETFFINLTSPSNASISDATSLVTIIDDDINSGDFDGDGINDASVFRPNADGQHVAKWYILHSGSNVVSGGVSFTEIQFGAETDIPVGGDFDGNGTKDVAVFRPNDDGAGNSAFYVSHGTPQNFDKYVWGLSTDKPVPGDYDGDLKTDVAVFRPSDGNWYIRKSSDGSLLVQQWGLATDKLVPADYDADGKTDVAVFRNDDPVPGSGRWYIRRSSDGGFSAIQWGLNTDKVVPADYDVDGKADVAVWRPSDGTWYILRSSNGALQATTFGAPTDLPVPGDYDGDSKADIAVWRPSDGTYYYVRSSDGSISFGPQWGQNGDIPVAARYVPEQ